MRQQIAGHIHIYIYFFFFSLWRLVFSFRQITRLGTDIKEVLDSATLGLSRPTLCLVLCLGRLNLRDFIKNPTLTQASPLSVASGKHQWKIRGLQESVGQLFIPLHPPSSLSAGKQLLLLCWRSWLLQLLLSH